MFPDNIHEDRHCLSSESFLKKARSRLRLKIKYPDGPTDIKKFRKVAFKLDFSGYLRIIMQNFSVSGGYVICHT